MADLTRWLLIDTCDRLSVIGVCEGDRLVRDVTNTNGVHATHELTRSLQAVTFDAGLSPADIHFIAATTGPGGFTSVRVGIIAATAIAQAWGKPLAGIARLRAAAVGTALADNTPGRYAVRFPAFRRQEYIAAYDVSSSGAVSEIVAPRVAGSDEIAALLPSPCLVARFEPRTLHLGLAACGYAEHLAGRTVAPGALRADYLANPTLGP